MAERSLKNLSNLLDDHETGDLTLEEDKATYSYLAKIISAAREENLSYHFMFLLLTAGPITFVALNIGYYIGYRKFASLELFVYFAAYSVVAGVLGILFRIYTVAKQQDKDEKYEDKLKLAMDILLPLRIAVRNYSLTSLPLKERIKQSAVYLLQNSHIDSETLKEGIHSLSGDTEIADLAVKIDLYRKAGLTTIIPDLYAPYSERCAEIKDELATVDPEAADYFMERMQGITPTLKNGLPRSEGFIERLLAWLDTNNITLLRSRDVEALITLTFELMCGRRITWLKIRGYEKGSLHERVDALEKARNASRISIAARLSRLQTMRRFLIRRGYLDAGSAEIENAGDLLDVVDKGIHNLAESIRRETGKFRFRKTPQHQLRLWVHDLCVLIDSYEALILAHGRVRKCRESLEKEIRKWTQISTKGEEKPPYFSTKPKKDALHIETRYIALTPQQRLELANTLYPVLKPLNKRRLAIGSDLIPGLRYEDIHVLTTHIVEALEKTIHINNADVQRAIEMSNAANFESIEPSFSSVGKSNLGHNLVSQVEAKTAETAERLFKVLLTRYGLAMNEDTITYFIRNFGASRHALEQICTDSRPGIEMPKVSQDETLKRKPLLHSTWRQCLEKGQKYIKQNA